MKEYDPDAAEKAVCEHVQNARSRIEDMEN